MSTAFWHTTELSQMTPEQWESLCDGCGICCLNKIVDADTDEKHTTAVACRLLNLETGQCSNYKHRRKHVTDCIKFTPKTLHEHLIWLPDSCAYKLLMNGYDLPEWHPLITGDSNSVRESGFSIVDLPIVSEEELSDPQDWWDRIIVTG